MRHHLKKYWIGICIAFGICIFLMPVGCILILGGVVFGSALHAIFVLRKLRTNGLKGQGIVVGFEEEGDRQFPLIEFTTSEGKQVRKIPYVYSSWSFNGTRIEENTKSRLVPLTYNPADPEKFVLGNKDEFDYFEIVLLLIVGLALIVFFVCEISGLSNLIPDKWTMNRN